MKKIFAITMGMILSSFGLFFIGIYLNLLTFGYSFLEYVHFISSRIECYLLLIGILVIFCSLFERKGKNAFLL